ncbi:hypothetical protein [Nitrosomonas sp. Nm34]|uniref:hypothetical protein n=1 Tax=Nitrosomonas sp. Nm34 TaxID=1881055 RepID=UPI0008F0C580|nr:hypothetical protein [Nitrosomonas sp. Nm34]SFJ00573.1 hypothetical protein SAMN05428978_10798 [Nitrosomonas sp. Nm34]
MKKRLIYLSQWQCGWQLLLPPVLADNAVNLRVLVISTGDETQDLNLSYIKPVLDEIGVHYEVLDASTRDL